MNGLPPEILGSLREILSNSPQFENQNNLKTFITLHEELNRFKDRIPQIEGISMRVDNTLAFFVGQSYLPKSKPPLISFIDALIHDQNSDDFVKGQLVNIKNKVDTILHWRELASIPFVTVAMTAREATELLDNKVNNPEYVTRYELEHFEVLKSKISTQRLKELLSCYRESRDDWHPDPTHIGQKSSIKDLIYLYARQIPSDIQLESFSDKFFDDNWDERLVAWVILGYVGCIILVDALSLFHPQIYRRLLQSELGANQNVALAIVVFSPEIRDDSILREEIKKRMQRAFIRFYWYEDLFCRPHIQDITDFRTWFKTMLSDMEGKVRINKQKPIPERKDILHPHPFNNKNGSSTSADSEHAGTKNIGMYIPSKQQ